MRRSSAGRTVYVAGFSGHILKFSAAPAKYLGEIAVQPAKGANKLSALAIVDGGKACRAVGAARHALPRSDGDAPRVRGGMGLAWHRPGSRAGEVLPCRSELPVPSGRPRRRA